MPKEKRASIVSLEGVVSRIFLVRGQKVMLDSDLATLYGVSTKRLNEQVRRNIRRFPSDFMFQLTKEEAESLRSQNATFKAWPWPTLQVLAIRLYRARRHHGCFGA